MKNCKLILLASLVLCGFATQAQIVTDYALGGGVTFQARDSSFRTTMKGRFQNLFTSIAPVTSEFGPEDFESSFVVRRARLDFSGYLWDPDVQYKMELGFSNLDLQLIRPDDSLSQQVILDAYVRWKMVRGLEVWFGQARLPGNRERVFSSQALQLVDRSLVNANFTLDRDLGMQLHYRHTLGNAVFREAVAVSQGEGRGAFWGNLGGYSWLGRAEVLPFGEFTNRGDYFGADLEREQTPKIMIGVAYEYNDNAVRERGQLGPYIAGERDLRTLIADGILKYMGWMVHSEFAMRQVDVPVVYNKETRDLSGIFYTGWGMNGQVGYLLNSNWEFAGRYTYIEPNGETGRGIIREHTAGISKYVAGHNLKVQTDASYTVEDGSDDALRLRLQVEVGF